MSEHSAPRRPGAAPLPPVATVFLDPDERMRVDAAGAGLYRALHRDSVDEAIRDLRDRRAGAVVLGAGRVGRQDAAHVARMVREFPRVAAVALLSGLDAGTPQRVLSLGRSGVETLIDVRQAQGWRELRGALLADRGLELRRQALARLDEDLAGAPPDVGRFLDALFAEPAATTVQALARRLGALPSTLTSRFLRAGLPTPRRYLCFARLVRAARLFEQPGLSVAAVATRLDYSSPQSFCRHVRTLLGLTAGQFRRRYDGEGMLRVFRDQLVLPHLAVLRAFRPLDGAPGWMKEGGRASGA